MIGELTGFTCLEAWRCWYRGYSRWYTAYAKSVSRTCQSSITCTWH